MSASATQGGHNYFSDND